jgi:hypothetical protein
MKQGYDGVIIAGSMLAAALTFIAIVKLLF